MDKIQLAKNNLWHYTTIDGLKGILESQRIWATDYRHLNDSSELNHAKSILQTKLFQNIVILAQKLYNENIEVKENIDKNGGVEHTAREETEEIVDILWKALLMDGRPLSAIPCISSFCLYEISDKYIQRDGLLSQWRGYGTDGGCAIIFNLPEMIQCFEKESEDFRYAISGKGDACYRYETLDRQHDLFKHLNRVTAFAWSLYSSIVYCTDKPQADGLDLSSLVHCLTRFKHRGFEEEKEYRFFVFPYTDKEAAKKIIPLNENDKSFKKIQNRLCRGTSVSYVELFETIPRLPIERIVVGPHKNKDKRVKSLLTYLKSKELQNVKVDCSDIPYIGMSHSTEQC